MARRTEDSNRFDKLNSSLGAAAYRRRCPSCMRYLTPEEIRIHKRWGCSRYNAPHVHSREVNDAD